MLRRKRLYIRYKFFILFYFGLFICLKSDFNCCFFIQNALKSSNFKRKWRRNKGGVRELSERRWAKRKKGSNRVFYGVLFIALFQSFIYRVILIIGRCPMLGYVRPSAFFLLLPSTNYQNMRPRWGRFIIRYIYFLTGTILRNHFCFTILTKSASSTVAEMSFSNFNTYNNN